MASRKETNRYYPPDWDPSKGSLNTFHGESWRNGSATVNGRAGAAKGIKIIRFETPWNMWCTGCDKMVGRGVRYNAEKNAAGKYYTTTLWEFTMKCHMCDGTIIIGTDPKNDDYKIVAGARRKEETWSTKSSETMALMDPEDKKRLELDPMYRLEHVEGDKQRAQSKKANLTQLLDLKSGSDYDLNSRLRANFRVKRKQLKKQGKADGDLMVRASLEHSAVSLLPESADDRAYAGRVRFGDRVAAADPLARRKRELNRSSIFSTASSRAAAAKKREATPRIDVAQFRLLSNKPARRAQGGRAKGLRGVVIKPKQPAAAAVATSARPQGLVSYDDDDDDD